MNFKPTSHFKELSPAYHNPPRDFVTYWRIDTLFLKTRFSSSPPPFHSITNNLSFSHNSKTPIFHPRKILFFNSGMAPFNVGLSIPKSSSRETSFLLNHKKENRGCLLRPVADIFVETACVTIDSSPRPIRTGRGSESTAIEISTITPRTDFLLPRPVGRGEGAVHKFKNSVKICPLMLFLKTQCLKTHDGPRKTVKQ